MQETLVNFDNWSLKCSRTEALPLLIVVKTSISKKIFSKKYFIHTYFIYISFIENEGLRKIQPQPLQYPPLLGPGWNYRTSPLSVEKLGPKRGWIRSIGAFLGLQPQILAKISKIRGPSARSNCLFYAFNALFSLRKLEGIDAT